MADVPVFLSETMTLTCGLAETDKVRDAAFLLGPVDDASFTFTRDSGSTPTVSVYVSNDPARVTFDAAACMLLEANISTAVPYGPLVGARGRYGRYWFKGVTIGNSKFLKIHVTRSRPF